MTTKYYKTPLSIEDCMSIISRQTRKLTFKNTLKQPQTRTIFSSVQRHNFRLFAPREDDVRNITPPYFFGAFKRTPQGTIIKGRFTIHPLGIALYLTFFVLFLVAWTLIILNAIWPGLTMRLTKEANSTTALVSTTIMMISPLVMFVLSWRFGRAQRVAIEQFINIEL